jgi:hypothetical protein
MAGTMLLINLSLLSYFLSQRRRQLRATTLAALRRFLTALHPIDVPLTGVDDFAHALLQLGCAAYCGRVIAERAEWLPAHSHPLDFASAGGLALHTSLGVLAWAWFSALGAAATAVQDAYAAWRWTSAAVALAPHTHGTGEEGTRGSRRLRHYVTSVLSFIWELLFDW